MAELFTIQSVTTLGMLILLQAVLGFDNLLYISLESKRVEESKQQTVRRLGIGLAIVLRIVLLIILIKAIDMLKGQTLFAFDFFAIVGQFDGHSLIVLFGGGFIMYTATKEIWHMMSLEEEEHGEKSSRRRTAGAAVFWIVDA